MHPSPVEDVLPLAPLQEGLLFHSLYEPEFRCLYLTQTVVRLIGPLNPDQLRRGATALLARHPNLRASFRYRKTGEPVQVIRRDPALAWTVLTVPDAESTERAIDEDWRSGVDVGAEALLRFTLIREGEAAHVLVITAHHLLLDGWSEMLMLRELVQLYLAGGERDALPPPPAFGGYLSWLRGRDRAAAESAWRAALTGFAAPACVASGRERRADVEPVDITADLSPRSTDSLRAIARASGCTVNTVIQAAWALSLSRHLGTDDVAFGTTVTVRPPDLDGAEDMIGLLINTVPVRIRIEPGDTFRDLVTRIHEQRTALMDHDYLGLADIQRIAGSTSALFDTNVVFDNFPMNDYDLGVDSGDVILRDFRYRDTSHYPLTLVVEPRDSMRLRLHYHPDVFPVSLMRAWVQRLARLLETVGRDQDRGLDTIDLLGEHERQEVLVRWNDAHREVPDSCLAELFENQVAAGPERPALSCGGTTLSYSELNDRANRLAWMLIDAGAGPEDYVGIFLPRSIDAVVAMLAAAKAGAAYLPIDPEYPVERVRFMLADASPRIVVTSGTLSPAVPADLALAVDAPGTVDALAGEPGTDPTDQDLVRPSMRRAAAYVVYTSGSTGRPKGVVVERSSMSAYLQRCLAAYPEARGSAVVHSSMSFDLTITALFTPLVGGGHVTLADLADAASADVPQPTFMKCTPSTLALLDALPAEASASGRLILGGELLTGRMLRSWRNAHPSANVLNVYGATEATVNSTEFVIAPGTVPDDGPLPVGRPFWNTQVYVLDQRLQPVPPQVTGQIYIAGVQLARGYLGQSALTAERFVANPFGAGGSRMYRTGDLGRWTPDGLLEFAGRADMQIKLRGHRIEPGEIEAALTSRSEVAQATVFVREDRAGDPRLVAYAVPEAGAAADAGLLRQYLADRLPEYMVPSAVLLVESFPRTVNGKLDRNALPAPAYRGTDLADAPGTPREELLCELFAEVLGFPSVGVSENFFALGGHSLLAIRLVSRARSTFGRALTLRDLFDTPTVAGLAARLGESAAAHEPVTRQERGERIPLSSSQRSLWILEQASGPSPTYNVPLAARLVGPLDPAAVEAALTDVVARHESLRTTVEQDGEDLWQRVIDPEFAVVPFDVVTTTPGDVGELVDAASRCSFDLARELPIRGWLFAAGPDEHVLLILIHHIACDGPANLVLAQDLARAYSARVRGESPDWVPPAVQYPDVALWQRKVLGDEKDHQSRLYRQLENVKQLLDGIPEEIRLPRDHPRSATSASPRCGSVHFEVPPALHACLADVARTHGVTLFMAIQAALAALLGRLGGGEDIPIGVPVTGRTDEALADVVGYFINSLVLRNDLSGDPTFAELLSRVRDFDLAAFDNQDVPFETVVGAINPPRMANRTPMFQVRLVFNEDKERAAVRALRALPGVSVEEVPIDSAAAKFDLLFRFVERGDPPSAGAGLDCVLEYNADLFEYPTAAALPGRLLLVLRVLADDPDGRVSQVDVLLPAERRRVLEEWNATSRPVPWASLPELFEAQAAKSPHAPAVSCGPETLTYAELNSRANQLARHLVEAGVGPERTVAVVLHRSVDAVVAMLATSKAGGAYVPIDPDYPAERIWFVFADAAPLVVLTRAALADRLAAPTCLSLDAPPTLAALAGRSGANLTEAERIAPLLPNTPAYVIYTSGSTGRPKGVVVEHRSLSAYLARARTAYQETAGTAVLPTSLSFDLTVTALFTPLVNGGHVVLADLDENCATRALRPTFMKVTPSHLTLLDNLPDEASPSGTLVIGGEALRGEALRDWRACHREATVVNAYGPTELTVNCADHRIEPGTEVGDGPVPIGRPFWNTRAYVLDERLRPVPPGVIGELYVSGAPLARGYLNRPALTAERFVADPFSRCGERMYRTGDLVRWTSAGMLEFAGRADSQVKLRGHRIELSEIEATLTGHADVRQAVALLREDQPGDHRLVAYAVPRSGRQLDAAELHRHLATRLPEYMVPASVVTMHQFPRTVNDKLDRDALPVPGHPRDPVGDLEADDPRTPEEEALCDLFAEVLGLPRVGVHDDFFALGGHSLRAIRLIAKARAVLGAELMITSLFAHPTVAELAAHAQSATGQARPERPRLAAKARS